MKQYLSPLELSKKLSVCKKTIYRYVERGSLKEGVHYVKLPSGLIRFDEEAVDLWLDPSPEAFKVLQRLGVK